MKKILLTIAACFSIGTAFSQCNLAVSLGPDTTVCQVQYTIPVQVTGSFGNVFYQWFKNGLPVSAASIQPIDHADHDVYTVYVNDSSGCQNADTVTISVYRPYADTIYSCGNNVDTLDLGSGASQYNWFSFTDTLGGNSSISGTTRYFSATQPGTYYATAFYNSCSLLTSMFHVNSGCAPVASYSNSFTYNSQNYCNTSVVNFYGNVVGFGGSDAWQWNFGDGSPTFADPFNTFHTYTAPGVYTVSLTTTNPLGFSYTSYQTVVIQFTGLLTVNLPADTSLCQGQVCLSAQISGGNGPYSFLWSDGNTSDFRCFTHEYNRVLALTVTDQSTGCSGSDDIIFSVYNPIFGDTFYMCNNGSTSLDFGPGPQGTQYFWQSYTDTNGINYNISEITTFPISDTTQAITVMWPGQYFGSANFGSGCVLTSIFNVLPCSQSCDATFTYQHTQAACGDSLLIAANGNAPGTLYSWNFGDGIQFNDVNPTLYHYYTSTGVYTITLTVSNSSCIDTFSVPVVIQGNLIQVNLGNDTVACQTAGGLILDPIVSGGTSPFSFSWSNGSQQTFSVLNNVVDYMVAVYVQDANGCWAADSVRVTELSDTAITYSACAIPLQYCALAPNATYYTWTTGDTSECMSAPGLNNFGLTYGLPYPGCTAIQQDFIITPCVQNDSVWPGDANADGVVTNFDIINLGIAYNQTGPVRTDQSIGWYAHQAQWWNLFFNYGVNINHADCNGNGVINAADTLAISQNYLLTHQKVETPIDTTLPLLYIQAVSDTLGLNQQAVFKIMLSNSALTSDSIYGVSFTLNYSTVNGQASTAGLDFSTSWLAPVGNQLTFQKSSLGSIDVAVTRIDQTNNNGDGEVGTFMIVTTDNLSGITNLKVSLEDARALTVTGNEVLLGTKNDSTLIDPLGIYEFEALSNATRLFPNPATDHVWVSCTAKILKAELLDISGRMVLVADNLAEGMNTSSIGKGSYQLKLATSKGTIFKKVILR